MARFRTKGVKMKQFMWRGEPIKDIHKWCRDNDTVMVKCKRVRKYADIFSGEIKTETTYEEMPELFYNSLCMTPGAGFVYKLKE